MTQARTTMHALVAQRFSADAAGVALEERAVPVPGPGEVLVRMHYAAINPSDFNHIRGTYRDSVAGLIYNRSRSDTPAFDPDGARPCPLPPMVLGAEGMGTVVAQGGGLLARLAMGKRVAVAANPTGTWAEYLALPAKRVLRLPDTIDDVQGAMCFVNPLAAYLMVRELLCLKPGDWLLQSGGGSALGQMVIRLGRRFGFRTISVVRRAAGVDALRALGGEVVLSTETDDVLAAVHRATAGRGATAALDCIGGTTTVLLAQSVGLGGRVICYGTLSGEAAPLNTRLLMMPLATIEGFFLGNWLAARKPLKLLSVLRTVRGLIADGTLASAAGQTYALGDWREALKAAEAPGRSGKVLFKAVTESSRQG